jgi:hypothetical protein
MSTKALSILNDPIVCAALKQAWDDSQPGLTSGHEGGGFILRDKIGNLSVKRWLRGQRNSIIVPPHPNCQIDNQDIVATFHTHPNTGADYIQEPSETDKRAVRDDPHLKASFYEGEFVLSAEVIYQITPAGQVNEAGKTKDYLGGKS